ncbi:LSU ribosomal protein L35p [Planctomycetales bacterium 10988]|nr:LSU ribosomal protein L35p [Planctomycetales bacterium 10988]
MPKQKTHKGIKKRFRLTASGKVKHKAAGNGHLASRKKQKRKRQLLVTHYVDESHAVALRDALGKHSY